MTTPIKPTRITVSTGKRNQTPMAHLIHEPVTPEPVITPVGSATAVVLAVCIVLIIGLVIVIFGRSA